MRDVKILEEWLVKVRSEKMANLQRTLVSARSDEDRIVANHYAHVIDLLTQVIGGIHLLEKDTAEFIKQQLS